METISKLLNVLFRCTQLQKFWELRGAFKIQRLINGMAAFSLQWGLVVKANETQRFLTNLENYQKRHLHTTLLP